MKSSDAALVQRPRLFARGISREQAKARARADIPLGDYLPYAVAVSDTVIKLRGGELASTWCVQGIPFETEEVKTIGDEKRRLVNILHSIRSTDLAEPTALWIHRVRREVTEKMTGTFPSEFATKLQDALNDRVDDRTLLRSEWFVTLISRPLADLPRDQARARRRTAESLRAFDNAALARFETLCKQFSGSLQHYGGVRLTTVMRQTRSGASIAVSEPLSFYNFLLTGVNEPVPLQRGLIHRYLASARVYAGNSNGIVQIEHPDKTTFQGFLELQDFPQLSEPGMNNCLFYGATPFVETQSFTFMGKREGEKSLKEQKGRMISSGESSEAQELSLDEAIEDVRNGHVFVGQYHYTLSLHGRSVAEVQAAMASARSVLQEDAGYKVVTLDTVPEAGYLAQLPGNWDWRPRPGIVTSRNFASLASLHNFDLGKPRGNPWGDSIAFFETPSRQGYHFNFHISQLGVSSVGMPNAGNTFVCGKTGVGKTALVGTLITLATKVPDLRVLWLDKDRGAEILIRALGGVYRRLERGQPTGFNPFRWAPTPRTIAFCESIVRQCALRPGEASLTIEMERQLAEAVRAVFTLAEPENRRISTVLLYVSDDELTERLRKWTRVAGEHEGGLAWVLDNEVDTTDFSGASIFGYDYTDFLADPEVGPIALAYILEAANTLIDGRPFLYVMEEFAAMVRAKTQTLVEFATDKQTTIRKLNGLGVFVTQSPSQVAGLPIGKTLVEQCVTSIFLPNPDAAEDDYVKHFNLTPTEFRLVRSLSEDSRMFLVKHNGRSALCRLDMGGMLEQLVVLSGTLRSVEILDSVRSDLGTDDPQKWLPVLIDRVRRDRLGS